MYAEKVQHKIERGDTWLGFTHKYGTDSHPHELMAAERELAPKLGKKLKEDDKVKAAKDDRTDKTKKTCPTWNTSTASTISRESSRWVSCHSSTGTNSC